MTNGLAGSLINFIKAKANCFGLYVFLVDSIARDAVDIGGLAMFSTTVTPIIWKN
ncbi:hypothetical protein OAI10_01350 [bacterium]|nr:hypothetical protein [bacterium]